MCDCIETRNRYFAAGNINMEVETFVDEGVKRAAVLFKQISNRQTMTVATMVPATYCPFCGQRYEVEPEDTLDKEVERRR